MSKKCPQCGTIAPDHFGHCRSDKCPWEWPAGDEKIVTDAPASETLNTKTQVSEVAEKQLVSVRAPHPSACSQGDVDGVTCQNSVHQIVHVNKAFDSSTCPRCHKPLASDMNACCYCAHPVDKSILPSQLPSITRKPNEVESLRPVPEPDVQSRNWRVPERESIPIAAYYNANKTYFVKEIGFIHLLIHNPSAKRVKGLFVRLQGKALQKPMTGRAPGTIIPGQTLSLRLPELLPGISGEDILDIELHGDLAGGEAFFLRGAFPIRIIKNKENPQHIHVAVTASGVGDRMINLPDVPIADPEIKASAAEEKWTLIELFFDKRRRIQEARFFPKSKIGSFECKIDPEIMRAMRALRPVSAPVATLSAQDGGVYFLVAGHTLLMGRDARRNHMPLILYPELDNQALNLTISRNHSRLFVRDRRVYIRDMSQTGIFVDGHPIDKGRDIMLSEGEILTFKNSLELQIHILTQDDEVLAVLVKRLNNNRRHTFILAHGPLPVGKGVDLSLGERRITDTDGFIYYHTKMKSWCFRTAGDLPSKDVHTALEPLQALTCGERKLWFSHL